MNIKYRVMKILKTVLVCALGAIVISCSSNAQKPLPGVSQGARDSASVAVGIAFGNMLKGSNMSDLDIAKITKTITSVLKGDTTLMFDDQTSGMYIQEYMMKASEALGKLREVEEKEFMASNKQNEGVLETESGLQYKIEVPGGDRKPIPEDTVEVNYKGTLLDGKVFDSSYERGETVKFPLNGVIPGWTEGLQLIGEGGKVKLWIPFNLAYGARDMGPNLPAYSTLVFDVELIKIMPFVSKEPETKQK